MSQLRHHDPRVGQDSVGLLSVFGVRIIVPRLGPVLAERPGLVGAVLQGDGGAALPLGAPQHLPAAPLLPGDGPG